MIVGFMTTQIQNVKVVRVMVVMVMMVMVMMVSELVSVKQRIKHCS